MEFSNILFIAIMMSVVGYFAFNLRATWMRVHAIGKGIEEDRTDNFAQRLGNVGRWALFQGKMFKDPVPGVMHAGIFWGFLVVSIGTIETMLHGIYSGFDFHVILGRGFLYELFLSSQDLGNFIVASAVSFAIVRRLFFPPERLKTLGQDAKKDAFIVLGTILVLVTTALIYMGGKTFAIDASDVLPAAPLGISRAFAGVFGGILTLSNPHDWDIFSNYIWWLHVVSLFGFMTFLPFSKHQHLIWVWPNMFFKSAKGSGRIRPMQFDENAESFGVGAASAFTWKQLLDSMTCVECGRCTAECPAYATGKPLDPRKIVHHLKTALIDADQNPEEDKRQTLIGGIVTREELWACTTCGACMNACPLEIEHIPAIVDMRRYMALTEGDMPGELQTALQNLENQSNPWGMSNDTRADWAKGLKVTTMAEQSDVEYLFWVGCAGSFDENYKGVSKSIVKILQEAKISFSILGKEEKCNGDTARRAGNEYLASAQIQENVETMKRYKVKKIVTGCPHCFNTIKNEYPDFDFKADVIHHSQLINQLIEDKRITPSKSVKQAESFTYHDSCYLGRHNGVYESPRKAIESVSSRPVVEMERSREKGFCCGAGGARMWMEEKIGTKINDNRAAEAISTGAGTVATACPVCMTMMRDGITASGKETQVKVRDIAQIVADSLNTERTVP
jgi:Fe-S oxidoreductase